MSKIRPQILVVLLILAGVAALSLSFGYIEVATGVVGGLIALSMKILETNGHGESHS